MFGVRQAVFLCGTMGRQICRNPPAKQVQICKQFSSMTVSSECVTNKSLVTDKAFNSGCKVFSAVEGGEGCGGYGCGVQKAFLGGGGEWCGSDCECGA